MSLDAKLARVSAQAGDLDRKISSDFICQKKTLSRLRRRIPEFPTDEFVAHTRFLHNSTQFAIPIQNWKTGTPFYRESTRRESVHNIHSSKDLRSRRVRLDDDEVDYILGTRYATASLTVPLHGGVFEVVPVHREPVAHSHRCIWKEYM
jgi:hypothetical protein